ncbi:MAG: glycosyl hydrolase family 88 [Syntrophomonadaceae bacterium]|nr:glycosyl hydrolase family 88 [Syntrophomonadaceae bacterium]
MSEKDVGRRQRAVTSHRRKKYSYIAAAVIIMVIAAFLVGREWWHTRELSRQFDQNSKLLRSAVLADTDLAANIGSWSQQNRGQFVVFFSICDTRDRAIVKSATGQNLEEAWNKVAEEMDKFVLANKYEPTWVKADIVTKTARIKSKDLGKQTKNLYDNFFRQGIAFDDQFGLALLEVEVNGNKIIDYDDNKLDLGKLNDYLEEYRRGAKIEEVPDQLILFISRGFFCDDRNQVFNLYDNDMDFGRRKIETVDQTTVKELIHTSSQFLADLVQDDGKFIYGYYPTYDKELTDYNIVRHSSTIWSIIAQYRTTGDESLPPKIEKTINHLIDNYIAYPDPDTAYVIERKDNEVKLGANAVAIITLIDYMEEFHNDKYKGLVVKLGNGILKMQDAKTGKYYHVLNYPDFSRKEELRTVYYDGEATFALAKLYGYGRDEKYLMAARKAADYFIANDYTVYADHWIAYSMNEITKHAPEERYFEFALKNAQNNLDKIYNQETSYHTYLELLMATFELYDRVKRDNIQVKYLASFDETRFIATIYHRARHQLNGYLYPEYAMYLKNPARIVNTFCVRHDGYRIRIDDVQHFIGGYYAYYSNYGRLEAYKHQFGL